MSNNKILTISIAAYNVADSLDQTIESLISIPVQDLEKLEIIIVDDGSKDDTSKIADNFAKKYPDTIRLIHKINGGYGSTINTSLPAARGKYYKQLDGGDQFFSNNLSEFIAYLNICESDLVLTPYTRYYIGRKKDELFDRHPNIGTETCDITALKYLDELHMYEISFKADIIKKSGMHITEKCFYTDTEYVYYSLLPAKSISRFPKPIYRYYIGEKGQSVSTDGRIKHWKDSGRVARKLISDYSNAKIQYPVDTSIMSTLVTLANYHLENCLLVHSKEGRNEANEFRKFIGSRNSKILDMVKDKSKTIRAYISLGDLSYAILSKWLIWKSTK